MEADPVCRTQLCSLCHGDLEEQLEKSNRNAPRYAKLTNASTARAIAIRLSSQRKPQTTFKDIPPKSKFKFEQLPVEIRLQIYRDCRYQPFLLVSHITGELLPARVQICGWVKGGGLHTDYQQKLRLPRIELMANLAFYTQILRLNRQIYAEAKEEIYRNINFQIRAHNTFAHLPLIKYWLTEHPMGLTTHMLVHMDLDQGKMWDDETASDVLLRSIVKGAKGDGLTYKLPLFIRKMPNLKRLDIMLRLQQLWPDEQPHVYPFTRSINRLVEFRSLLPKGVVLRVCLHPASDCNRNPILLSKVLAFEKVLRVRNFEAILEDPVTPRASLSIWIN